MKTIIVGRLRKSLLRGVMCLTVVLSMAPGAGRAAQSDFPGLVLQSNFTARVFAGTNQVGNAVAICFDGPGRLYSVEANRRVTGTWGVTMSRWWSMEDYAGKTLQDRADMYARWTHIVPPAKLTRNADVLRRISDPDGDGRADKSKVLREYAGPLDGNAAGIVARDRDLFVANAPRLMRLGTNGVQKDLVTGLGVRVGVYGHDLHGLNWGPDGRLYFSIGDRGFNLVTQAGKRLMAPTRGAVFRCFPDGSGLELFHLGLRNPQDLAFNEVGDLFTVDNDMGGVDKSRVVQVVEGGDSGWDATYQLTRNFREETDRHDHPEPPWFTENLWQTRQAGQPAWLHPPIAYLTHGPSGMEFDPGWGLPERYRNSFFVCDFRGTSSRSGIYSFHLAPEGAGYGMSRTNTFAWGTLPADIEFGWDGRMYLADWIGGWGGGGRRRIVRLETDEGWSAGDAAEVTEIMRQGFGKRSEAELARLLGHRDRRVRLFAQYELADRSAVGVFLKLSGPAQPRSLRLQAIWGLWQLGLKDELTAEAKAGLTGLLTDTDREVGAQAAKVLGEIRHQPAGAPLLKRLKDHSSRIRYFAAEALGKLGRASAVPGLLELLRDNADRDITLRHSGVLALSRIASSKDLLRYAEDPSPAVRRGVLLAWRRQAAPEMRHFLGDPDAELVWEAVRAIHDLPIVECLPVLAGPGGARLLADRKTPFPILQRILNANFRLGRSRHAGRVATLAASREVSPEVRLEALRCLERWEDPSPFDRVTWHHRPLVGKRNLEIGAAVRETAQRYLFGKRDKGEAKLLRTAARLAVKHDLVDAKAMKELLGDASLDETTRIAFLNRLVKGEDTTIKEICRGLLADKSVKLRLAAARPLLTDSEPLAEQLIGKLWQAKDAQTRQAVVETVAQVATKFAKAFLGKLQGQSGPTALDVLEAGLKSADPGLRATAAAHLKKLRSTAKGLGEFSLTLSGGDAALGKRIFGTHAIQCVRCHQIKGFGGDAGPDLSKIGRTLKPEQLVESLIEPSVRIAEGFGTFEFELKDGESVAGFVRSEDAKTVTLALMDGRELAVPQADIRRRSSPASAMPSMREALTRREIRDLVAYLSGLK
jgi:quinoprotein glucose dehydrogenase